MGLRQRRSARPGDPRQRQRDGRRLARVRLGACVLLAAAVAARASAQNVPLHLSIDTGVSVTTDTGQGNDGVKQGAAIASVRPALAASHVGANLTYDLDAAVTFLDATNGAQRGVLPDLHGALKATLVDRWLYFDASGYVRYAEADPFGVRADDAVGSNRRVESDVLLAPTIRRELGPDSTFVARQEFGSASNSAGEKTTLDSSSSLISYERKPTPLGMSASLSRLENRTSGDGDGRYTLETARLTVDAIAAEDLEIGAVAGEDRSEYLLSGHTDALYGAVLKWTPTPRTNIRFDLEHRYFGESGTVAIEHRTPWIVFGFLLSRQPVDSSSSFGTLSQGTDIRNFLNSILTTRYPDPSVRAGIVDGIISSHGLSTRTSGAVNIVASYPQLQSSAQASLTILGTINTASLTGYTVTTRALTRGDDPLSGTGTAVADNRQWGGAFQLNHRITPETSAEVQMTWSKIEGLAATSAERSDELTYRASLTDTLSPRSRLTVALQWNRFNTNALGQHSFDATLALVGLDHRF